jgi:hypothetical protein
LQKVPIYVCGEAIIILILVYSKLTTLTPFTRQPGPFLNIVGESNPPTKYRRACLIDSQEEKDRAENAEDEYAEELVKVEMIWTNRIGVQFDYVLWW